MIYFRDIPEIDHTTAKKIPPSTWPFTYTPASYSVDESFVIDKIKRHWKPWWSDVNVEYLNNLDDVHVGINSIAHAMHLDWKNAWSYAFCLSYCEANLRSKGSYVYASNSLRHLPQRSKGMIDEVISCAVSNAIASSKGFHYLGDLKKLESTRPYLFYRRWKGNGPDYLHAKFGAPSDGVVAEYLFLEAKGIAGDFTTDTPRNFYAYKTQSMNVDLYINTPYRPILSYVYMSLNSGYEIKAQWFNASEEEKDYEHPDSKNFQGYLLLLIAEQQFSRILRNNMDDDYVDSYMDYLNYIIVDDNDDFVIINTRDKYYYMYIRWEAFYLFNDIRLFLGGNFYSSLDLMRFLKENEERLKGYLKDLNDMNLKTISDYEKGLDNFSGEYELMSMDATGVIFLRRS